MSLSRRFSSHIRPRYLQKIRPLIDCLQELATAYDCTPAHIALNWLISYPEVSVFAIPGASSVKQATSNVKAMQIQLSPADWKKLSQISANLS